MRNAHVRTAAHVRTTVRAATAGARNDRATTAGAAIAGVRTVRATTAPATTARAAREGARMESVAGAAVRARCRPRFEPARARWAASASWASWRRAWCSFRARSSDCCSSRVPPPPRSSGVRSRPSLRSRSTAFSTARSSRTSRCGIATPIRCASRWSPRTRRSTGCTA